jgi:hypothetical protein
MGNSGIITGIVLSSSLAKASEGVIELENTNGQDSRCFAMSTLNDRSTSFNIQIQCQNLTYPIEPQGLYYVLWANPVIENEENETKPSRVGELGFGRETFRERRPFTGLFVTKEETRSPRSPSSSRVMEGDVDRISFLDTTITPTKKPAPTSKVTPKVTQKPTPTPQPKGNSIISVVISIIVFIIAVVIIIAIIFIVVVRIRNSQT